MNVKHFSVVFSLSAIGLMGMSGCASFEGGYSDPSSVKVIDDKWNDTDARTTAEKMIPSCLSFPWLKEFNDANKGAKPTVLIGDFENSTEEHIDTKQLATQVRTELMKSGKVSFLDAAARDQAAKEYEYQKRAVKKGTEKKEGKQKSADFFLNGQMSAIVNKREGDKRVTYKVYMRLTDIESNEIKWEEEHTITKDFKRRGAGF